jgi:hypothetical protein
MLDFKLDMMSKNMYTSFKAFLIEKFRSEMILAYEHILEYRKLDDENEKKDKVDYIVEKFMKSDSELELNVTDNMKLKVFDRINNIKKNDSNYDKDLFDEVFIDVRFLLSESFEEFKLTKDYKKIAFIKEIQYFYI